MSNEQTHIIDFMATKKDNDRIDQIHEFNIDTECNHIFLFGEESYIVGAGDLDYTGAEPGVEYSMANRFIKNLNLLMRKNQEPILIHMKTCGGIWEEGMAIYDAIKACPNAVTILNYTHARSMSSLIFQAANKRVMMPHSYFLIHDGTNAYGGNTEKAFQSYADHTKTLGPIMLNIYIDQMIQKGKFKDKSREEIYAYLRDKMDKKEDVYWTAKQAVALGLADEIFGENGKYDWSKLMKYSKEELSR